MKALSIVKTIKTVNLVRTLVYGILLLGIYYSSFTWLVKKDWEREAYSYCWLIPPVVLFLIWLKRGDFIPAPSQPSWTGLMPLGLGIVFFWLGELSGEFFTLYMSFWLMVVGICWLHLGWQKLKIIGFALFFTLTMFPVPNFINTRVILQLRLISTKLGVALIQLYGLPAYQEGNVIDLGFTQLQVVDACSGLHSLISLIVLCLLLVYFFKDHWWKRVVLFFSSIPLAIITNSIRIAITAILYKYFGAKVAEGFFHGFSGLAIFAVCIPFLIIEMKILEKLPPFQKRDTGEAKKREGNKKEIPDFDSVYNDPKNSARGSFRQPVFITAVILLGATLAFSYAVEFREKIPSKKPLTQFPLTIGEWKSEKYQQMKQIFITALDLSEYVIADYRNNQKQHVNFYVAYYESQSKGESIHSPATCLPGSGSSFDQSGTVKVADVPGGNETIEVNRAMMQTGQLKQIAYYWFQQRGRILTNAYQLKIFVFWDALTKQRTDGALVRLITPVYTNENVEDADKRLQRFVRDIVPVLEEYIPGKNLLVNKGNG